MMSGTTSPRSSSDTVCANQVLDTRIEEGLHREELRAEQYGGDDPQEPLPKEGGIIPVPPESKSDPYKVEWDGPDDPANPQNWTNRYKWAITVLCTLMTVNVYVPRSHDVRKTY